METSHHIKPLKNLLDQQTPGSPRRRTANTRPAYSPHNLILRCTYLLAPVLHTSKGAKSMKDII